MDYELARRPSGVVSVLAQFTPVPEGPRLQSGDEWRFLGPSVRGFASKIGQEAADFSLRRLTAYAVICDVLPLLIAYAMRHHNVFFVVGFQSFYL